MVNVEPTLQNIKYENRHNYKGINSRARAGRYRPVGVRIEERQFQLCVRNSGNAGNFYAGAPQFQTSPSQTSATTEQPWASFLTGQLDEVRVYNKALSAAELQALIVLQGKGK